MTTFDPAHQFVLRCTCSDLYEFNRYINVGTYITYSEDIQNISVCICILDHVAVLFRSYWRDHPFFKRDIAHLEKFMVVSLTNCINNLYHIF